MIQLDAARSPACILIDIAKFDASAVPAFKTELKELDLGLAEALDIDLQKIEFMDSSGVGALLSLYKNLPAETRELRLVNVRPVVRDVLELLRLHRIFTLVPQPS